MKRLDYIDTAKGILIILVVIGHILTGENYARSWIWTFHIPAFFLITGLLINHSSFKEKSFGSLLMSNIRSLVVPYFIFEAIGAFSCRVTHLKMANLNGYLYETFTLQYNNVVDWYLVTLFIAELIVFFILKIHNTKVIAILGIVSLILGMSNACTLLCRSLVAVFFILLGYMCEQYTTTKNSRVILLCIIIVSAIAALNGRVDLNNMRFNNHFLYVLGSVSGSVLILSISKLMPNRLLNTIGRNSLIIMGIHIPIIQIVRYLVAR